MSTMSTNHTDDLTEAEQARSAELTEDHAAELAVRSLLVDGHTADKRELQRLRSALLAEDRTWDA